MEVVYKDWKKRLTQCTYCDYSVKNKIGITCGTLIIGDVVNHEGKQVHLCGCIMKIKTKLTYSQCPINKWKD
jgi:hypothetical protein